MKSSTGAHYPALDHVRAVAAWLVFTWHFTHGLRGSPVPFQYVPAFAPAALLDEGHTGVALFMTLSGYLFAKLLAGRSVHIPSFLWNRMVRLLPLLVAVLMLAAPWGSGISGFQQYAVVIGSGVFLPTLPNGGWSITTEFHFYLLLPVFLFLTRRSRVALFAVVAGAIAGRLWWHSARGEIQWLAYWTIVGRIDQFALGLLSYYWRREIISHSRLVVLAAAAFIGVFWYFDATGGFYLSPTYPSPRPIWIVLPTLEGAAYGAVIATYDQKASGDHGMVARLVGRLGGYSYSIYLLHFFFVFRAARLIDGYVMDLSSFPVACAWATLCFVLMLVPGYLSFRFVEEPCLRWRRRYVVEAPPVISHSAHAVA